ncbi:Golgi SNAP receptor complex member 1-2 isoform X1 [Momordica charantia]|uniref:Golgi SNAP receptor complex member 1-2 isoform X1 n=1 Tax=Momordica charantia TaxID=3673 RepID=A0A6J1DXE1_MOMCH|nr:Golgi SNAP receptor complex member 1-2 isoform X1 [Momordica charantia]
MPMTDQSLELQESGWEELRREARKIEGDLDVKLSSYAKLGTRFTQGGYVDSGSSPVGSNRSWKSMEMEIQSLLEKLLDANDSMSRCAASASPATSVNQKLARHRDILHDFTQNWYIRQHWSNKRMSDIYVLQEFKRIKGNINSMREHAELLSSVRDDISEYKSSGTMSPKMQLLRERASIHGSIAHMDEVISQAQTTRAVLGNQRAMFGDVQGKVKLLSDKFPVIRGLLGSIRRKRSRDTLILSGVIAACTLFLIVYWLSK